jgi:hypothetical protein
MLPLLFLFAFSIPAPTTSYPPLADYSWTNCDKSTFSAGGHTVNYTYCTNQNKITKQFIALNSSDASESFFRFLRSRGYSTAMCAPERLLEIYEVTVPTLNNPNRFNLWQANTPGVDEIWALYDNRARQPGLDAIVITNHYGYNELNLAHELAHYWIDRFCLNGKVGSEERFISAFESFYLAER